MKTRIDGISYSYDAIFVPKRDKFHFSIKATYKTNRRSSTITNVNPILSEFNIPESDKRFKESVWVVNQKRSMFLMNMAKQLLSDRSYQRYLERILDEDRKQSEWENIETSSA